MVLGIPPNMRNVRIPPKSRTDKATGKVKTTGFKSEYERMKPIILEKLLAHAKELEKAMRKIVEKLPDDEHIRKLDRLQIVIRQLQGQIVAKK